MPISSARGIDPFLHSPTLTGQTGQCQRSAQTVGARASYVNHVSISLAAPTQTRKQTDPKHRKALTEKHCAALNREITCQGLFCSALAVSFLNTCTSTHINTKARRRVRARARAHARTQACGHAHPRTCTRARMHGSRYAGVTEAMSAFVTDIVKQWLPVRVYVHRADGWWIEHSSVPTYTRQRKVRRGAGTSTAVAPGSRATFG